MYDVIIIGASSSGLYAAELLARAGKKVAVVECQKQVDPARRTLIVTPEIRRLLGPLSPPAKLHSIHIMALSAGEVYEEIRFDDPDPIVERNGLASLLERRAREAGTEILLGHRFLGFSGCHSHLEVRLANGNGEERLRAGEGIIGADGVSSGVARAAGIEHAPSVPIIQAEITLPEDWDPRITRVWFDAEDTRFFYWLIPEDETQGVLGLVGDDGPQARRSLEAFLAREGLRPRAYQAAQVALHHPRLRPWARLGEIPVYLVGDAAGQVKVTTVGGTVPGFLGARAAVRALLRGTSYRAELRGLKKELDLHWWIRWWLDRLDNRGYARLIQTLSSPLREFLARHNRDRFAPVAWKLPFVEPRLLTLARHFLRRKPPAAGPVKTTTLPRTP